MVPIKSFHHKQEKDAGQGHCSTGAGQRWSDKAGMGGEYGDSLLFLSPGRYIG